MVKRPAIIFLLGAFVLNLAILPLFARDNSSAKIHPSFGDKSLSIDVGGRERSFIVHIPPGYSNLVSLPIVIMLHGGGGTAEGAIKETGWEKKADEANFIAVFPEGLPRDPDAPPRFLGNPRTWNDGSQRFSNESNDIAFLAGIIDYMKTKFNADPKRIFITGFSNGASMTFHAGAQLADRVAAVAPVAGAFWSPPNSMATPVSLLYITGAEDPLNRIEGGVPKLAMARWGRGIGGKAKPPLADSINAWLKLIEAPITPVESTSINGVSLKRYKNPVGAEVAVYIIADCGHTWPGGISSLPEAMVGKSTNKMNATDVIWDFFCHHSRLSK